MTQLTLDLEWLLLDLHDDAVIDARIRSIRQGRWFRHIADVDVLGGLL